MSVIRRQGVKNTVYTYLGIFLGIFSTLYIQPFFLSKEQIGITRLIISLGTIFASISCFGITSIIVKFLPVFYAKEKKHHGFFTLVVGFPLAGFLICFLLIFFFKDPILNFYSKNAPILVSYFLPITFIALLNSLIFSFTAYCNAINKSSLSTFVNEIINRIGFIFSILLFSYSIYSQNTFIYSLSIIYLFQLILLFSIISYYDHTTFTYTFFINNLHLKEILRFGMISAFVQITSICIKFIDIILVGKYESMDKVGIYGIAAFIGLVIETPLNAIEKIAGTKISQLFTHNNLSEIENIYKLSSKYLLIFCGLLTTVLVVCIHPIMLILPNNYSDGAIVTIIISIGALFNAATGVNYSILIYSRHYKLGAIFYFILLLLTILLNMILIPLFGITGAAIATCSISIIHNLLRLMFIKIKLNMQPFSINSLKIVLIILLAISIGFIIKIENKYVSILLRASVSSLTFILLLIITKTFSIKEIKEEFLAVKKVFI